MKKILSIVLLALVFVVPADAQVVQPVYIRQARLTPILAFDDQVASSLAGTSSKIWDMTTFASVTVQFVPVSGCSLVTTFSFEASGTLQYLRLRWLYSGDVTSGPVAIIVQSDPTSTGFTALGGQIASRSVTVPAACTFDVYIILNPVSSRNFVEGVYPAATTVGTVNPVVVGGYDTSGGVYQKMAVDSSGRVQVVVTEPTGTYTSISPTNVTTVATVATMTTSVRATLQNNGTGAALCLITTNASATVDANTYSFSLSAATAVNDGSGSTWTAPAIPNATTYIRCAALSGTARISGFTHP